MINLAQTIPDDTRLEEAVSYSDPFRAVGQLHSVQGAITVSLPASIGELVQIRYRDGGNCLAEVIGFSGDLVQIMPFGSSRTLQRRDEVVTLGRAMKAPVGRGVLGRVINAIGEPIDDKGPLQASRFTTVSTEPPAALKRQNVTQPFVTGQRAIDGLLTIGKGQRMGLFAGSGVGKSTLLGQIARNAKSDLNVVALIGERGREVLPFIRESLGEEGMARSIVIVSTANESPLARVRAAESAITIANWFRSQDNNVLLMLDSLTRFAMAQRDLGLMLGEPPTSRGYTPSVFQKMAVLLEQLGNSDRGSITGILTILVEGDDMNDPVADTARSILDGHIVLDRMLANAGHFPAIDSLSSASRLFLDLVDREHSDAAKAIRQILKQHNEVIDLVQVGAYQAGVSPLTDLALALYPEVCQFLQQDLGSPATFEQTRQSMNRLATRWNNANRGAGK
jgi:flagellum-specific ATP synthase